ncbi:GTP pyrophosphokinase [Roseibacillus persicicus]|uniref:GTP pyrophosphokinase n=2 Tax=Roseibacillus persicicus TaxID=454148 RepID=A0A918TQ00_9BACT|nr:GTP pyrophosphokinase [Roseibacillus persicicus]GHC58350.1 hypothetical protein GCM10007100_26640 [Roseibacillus persicicus]
MNEMEREALVKLAEEIATKAHDGQFRRGGIIPYIEHPRAVVERVAGDHEAEVVAWLHDVIEDTSESAESLIEAGVPEYLVAEVVLLTKTREAVYDQYLERIAASPIACRVKIADMLSNLADHPTRKQIRKYARGLLRLTRDSS